MPQQFGNNHVKANAYPNWTLNFHMQTSDFHKKFITIHWTKVVPFSFVTRFAKGEKFIETEVTYKHHPLVKHNYCPPYHFKDRLGPYSTNQTEVQQEENIVFLEEYLAQFCERLPSDLEVED